MWVPGVGFPAWVSRPLDVMHAVSKQGTSSQNSTPRPRSKRRQETMKVVSIAILRTGPDVAEPIPVSMACELSSYGFFQRQVRTYNVATEFLGVAFFFVPEEILMADTVCVCRNRGLWRKGSQECGKTFSIVHAQLAFGLRDILRRGPDQPLGFVVLGDFWAFSSCTLRPSRTDRPVREEWPRIY